jgi:hypothetical protein
VALTAILIASRVSLLGKQTTSGWAQIGQAKFEDLVGGKAKRLTIRFREAADSTRDVDAGSTTNQPASAREPDRIGDFGIVCAGLNFKFGP